MKITADQIVGIMRIPSSRATEWQPFLQAAMTSYDITSKPRIAAFLAQIAHESCGLVYTREIWNPKQCAWQAEYEYRKDLGNTQAGDGERFKGRGLIQITGRANYTECGKALGLDLPHHPELLESKQNAANSAAWFWSRHKLNDICDTCSRDAFVKITKVINGGTNGLADRTAFYQRAFNVLPA